MSEPSIAAAFAACRAEDRPALIPYVTAGFPTLADSRAALEMVCTDGADVVELGIPFTDPLADGPVIQRSTHVALDQGMTVRRALDLVREVRPDIPVVAFSYLNPILAYGPARFLDDAADAGVSGLLLTDLPAGADPDLEAAIAASPVDLIRLVALTTSAARLRETVTDARGFLYLIARLGVTGAPTDIGPRVEQTVDAIRRHTAVPVAVGFGIATGAQARMVARFADGVVVGSALIQRLETGLEPARALMRELRDAVAGARV